MFSHRNYTFSVLDHTLALKEGPTTFACKSQNADRQDWYIFSTLLCASMVITLVNIRKTHKYGTTYNARKTCNTQETRTT